VVYLLRLEEKERKMRKEGWIDYKEYLESDIWKKKRDKMVAEAGECEICGATSNLVVHHLRYQYKSGRSVLGRERKTDLAVLCWDCHKRMHEEYGRGASFGRKEIEEQKGTWLICLSDGLVIPTSKMVVDMFEKLSEYDYIKWGRIIFNREQITMFVEKEAYKDLIAYRKKFNETSK